MGCAWSLDGGRSRTRAVIAVLWAGCGCALACKSGHPGPSRPNVVLLSLDTTRADRLGCYGYGRRTTPNLDALAAESVRYTRAIATSSWTLPSHASLFTGKLTSSHGAEYDPEGPLSLATVVDGPAEWRRYRARGLAEGERTLAETLHEAGYATGAVVGGPWLKRPFGLAQGFDYYDDDQIDSSDGRRAEQVTAPAIRWLERTTTRPLFLFLNYYDPHGPYSPPEPYIRAFLPAGTVPSAGEPEGEERSARYDAEILYMDHHIGALLRRLRELRLYDDTLVIATADHGELLGEHGRVGHGQYLTQPEIHVPLLVKDPRRQQRGATSDAPIQLTDVFAIVLDGAFLPLPSGTQAGLPPRTGHPVVAEVHPLDFASADGSWRAIFDGSLKFLWNSQGRHQLFDLSRDSTEDVNLVERQPEHASRLRRLLERYVDALPAPGAPGPRRELDEETRKALRGLGYVQ